MIFCELQYTLKQLTLLWLPNHFLRICGKDFHLYLQTSRSYKKFQQNLQVKIIKFFKLILNHTPYTMNLQSSRRFHCIIMNIKFRCQFYIKSLFAQLNVLVSSHFESVTKFHRIFFIKYIFLFLYRQFTSYFIFLSLR